MTDPHTDTDTAPVADTVTDTVTAPDTLPVLPAAVPPQSPITLRVTPLGGNRVGLDLHADHWGGRALDPILKVGSVVLRDYEHPAPGVLRFLADDARLLPRGAPVTLQWGDQPLERFLIAPRLEVP